MSQTDSMLRELSRYEQFISRTGVMLVKQEVPLGRLRGVELRYRKAGIMTDKSIAESVTLGGYESLFWTTNYTLHIDKDELDEVIGALEYFKQIMNNGKPANEVRHTYITANRVVIDCGFMSTGIIRGWQLSIAQLYKHLPDIMPGTTVQFRDKDIDELIGMFKSGMGMQLK